MTNVDAIAWCSIVASMKICDIVRRFSCNACTDTCVAVLDSFAEETEAPFQPRLITATGKSHARACCSPKPAAVTAGDGRQAPRMRLRWTEELKTRFARAVEQGGGLHHVGLAPPPTPPPPPQHVKSLALPVIRGRGHVGKRCMVCCTDNRGVAI